jgi:two-component system chemotaxis response regulator CheY
MAGFDGMKALVIEDDDHSRRLLRQMLKEAGFKSIREASDGAAGLAIAVHSEPDLIFLDNQMPGKSGLEMLAEFRTAVPNSMVLMVTSDNDKETVVACLKAGARGYILKPFSALSLVRLVESIVARPKQTLPAVA